MMDQNRLAAEKICHQASLDSLQIQFIPQLAFKKARILLKVPCISLNRLMNLNPNSFYCTCYQYHNKIQNLKILSN